MANLIRGLSENGGVVFCGVDSTEIVRKAEKLHTTSATCSAALGRLLTGATLMGSMLKDDRDRITLRVAGGGPAGVLIACTDGTGNVKGCIDNPLVELPAKANGHLDVGTAVGKDGVLTVIRDNRLQKEPTVGQVPLVSGEIAEDLTSYYAYSEQVPTVMALGVLVDKDLSILCAGGFMVQLLPGATDAEIDQLERTSTPCPLSPSCSMPVRPRGHDADGAGRLQPQRAGRAHGAVPVRLQRRAHQGDVAQPWPCRACAYAGRGPQL